MATARLRLVPVGVRDARDLVAGGVPEVPAAPGWPPPETVARLRAGLEYGEALGWFVLHDGLVIGDCGAAGTTEIEIRYGIAPSYRGHGYGTEVVAALVAWASGSPGVHSVVADVRVENLPSRRALERCGFTVRGVHDRYVTYELAHRK